MIILASFLLVVVSAVTVQNSDALSTFLRFHHERIGKDFRESGPTRRMTTVVEAITPVGPFCPFRSSASIEVTPRMESLNTATPEFATEMARFQLDMQSGQTPDPERLKRVADGINAAVDRWENLIARLRLSQDFQTREYAKLTQAHLASYGHTVEDVAQMMRWQSSCMRAMADNKPPPVPPSGIDVNKMMHDAQQKGVKRPPSIAAMSSAQKITTTPFKGTEPAFQSQNVRQEYQRLCRDHEGLIAMGGSYAGFDGAGKVAFLNEIEKLEERWDVFFTRFSLLGQLNKDFVKQCNDFLTSMGMNEQEFRTLLKETHVIMREDAEKERMF